MADHDVAQAPAARDTSATTATHAREESGVAQVRAMLSHGGHADPSAIAHVIEAHPSERDQILGLLQGSAGNAFTQQVVASAQANAADPPQVVKQKSAAASSADAAKVGALLKRLGIDPHGDQANASTELDARSGVKPPKPVTDDEIEGLSPELHALFMAKLTASIDPTLVAAIKTAGGMVPFMKDMAAGQTIGGIDEAKFEQMWNVSADEAWLKDKFRAVDPSMHEWIPSNEVEAIVQKAKTAPGGASWIDLQNELRSPTNQVIFEPAKSSSISPQGTLVLRGHVGAIYLNGVMQTVDEAEFHDELRAAFSASKDIGNAVDLLKAVMLKWMWTGDALPKPLDPNLQNSVKQPIDEKALIADRVSHFTAMSALFDALKTKYGGGGAHGVPTHGNGKT
jgi:hypothetical protein